MIFADTFFYIALLNRHDEHHDRALALIQSLQTPTLTTEYVLTELLDGFNLKDNRKFAAEWVTRLRDDPTVTILPSAPDIWQRGFTLFEKRVDKEWSLTDCISFSVMTQHKITTALTHDYHFKQAGFHILL